MKRELYKRLHNDFPFFTGYYGLGCEVSCDDGWFDLIYRLSQDLEKLAEQQEIDLNVVQVKEKFAGLRYYLASETDEMVWLIREAEEKSFTICEHCGKSPAKQYNIYGWWKTMCKDCYNNQRKED